MASRCDKLAGIDVAAYLDAPEDARWGAVHRHVEKCGDCREEVAAWRSLRASLAENGDGHPAEELLLAYADERSSLAASVSAEIASHLAECASCRDEVGVLAAVTIRPSAAMAATATAERAESSVWHRILAALSGPVWRPALAVAIVVVLMVPALRWIDRDSALMQFGAIRNDEAMVVSSASDVAQALSGDASGTAASAVARREESRGLGVIETPKSEGAAPNAALPAAKRAPPATAELAKRNAWQQERDADLRRRQGQPNAERSAAWLHRDESSALAMRKGPDVDATAMPPTLEFVPGGRVSLPAGDYARVLLRISFVSSENASTGKRRDAPSTAQPSVCMLSPASASQLNVRVVTPDGREQTLRIRDVLSPSTDAASVVEVSVPAEWFADGENRVDIVEGRGKVVCEGLQVLRG